MQCKICGRERPIKFFPKRVIHGTGQVLRVCTECDHENIDRIAEKVAEKMDVDIEASAVLVRRRYTC